MKPKLEFSHVKKSIRLDPEYEAIVEEVVAGERLKAEALGKRGDLPWWRYGAPYTKQQVKLMVWTAKQNSNNPKVYFRGMLDGWFVGYSHKHNFWHDVRTRGYSYVNGRKEGSELFHRMEECAMFEPSLYPKFLALNIDKQVNTYRMWHHPRWCDDCRDLYRRESRIVGRLDGDRTDASDRMAYFSAKHHEKEYRKMKAYRKSSRG